jgi:hypothetical protein
MDSNEKKVIDEMELKHDSMRENVSFILLLFKNGEAGSPISFQHNFFFFYYINR